MVCKKCGEKLTQEMLDVNLCWSCGAIINESSTEDEIVNNNITTEEESESVGDSNNTPNSQNTVGTILYILGILILIFGTIWSFSASGGSGRYYHFTFSTFIIYEFASVLSGFMVIGMAQVIQLLHKINNKLK